MPAPKSERGWKRRANQFAEIQKAIRKIIPPDEIEVMIDNIGLPPSSINLTYNNTGVMGTQDGDIQIALKKGHQPTEDYVRKLRERVPPGVSWRCVFVSPGRYCQPDIEFWFSGAD